MPGGGITRNGRALRKANGRSVQRTLAGQCECCGGTTPPCCDPVTPCGQLWEVCVTEFEIIIHREFQETQYRFGEDTAFRSLHGTYDRVIRLRGGPYRYVWNPNVPPFPLGCEIPGQIPIVDTIIERQTLDYGPLCVHALGGGPLDPPRECLPDPTQRIDEYCVDVEFRCPNEASGTDSFPFIEWPTIEDFNSRGGTFGTTVVTDSSSFCGGVPQPPWSTTTTRHNTWRSGIGENSFDYDQTVSTPSYVFNANFICRRGTSFERTTVRYRYTVVPRVDCEGSPINSPCVGEYPSVCDGPNRYRLARQCGNLAATPLLIPYENVRTCGVVNFGGICYKVDRTSPIVVDPDLNNYVGVSFVLIDAAWRVKSCCECSAGCPNQPIPISPCWGQGHFNPVLNEWVPAPAYVTDENCCCDMGDILTIQVLESEWIQPFGVRDVQRLTAPVSTGRGVPWEYHTDNRRYNYFTGEFLEFLQDNPWRIAEWNCDNGPWGGLLNEQGFGPPNLQNPHEWAGLFRSFDITGLPPFSSLPCPTDPGGNANGLQIIDYVLSVDCTRFDLYCVFRNTLFGEVGSGGWQITSRLVITISNGNSTGLPQQCRGGCEPAAPEFPFQPSNGVVPEPNVSVRSILESF